MRHISDADAEADCQTGYVADEALIFLFSDNVHRANPSGNRLSAGRNGSPPTEAKRTPSLSRATRAWVVLAKLPGRRIHSVPRRWKLQIDVFRPGATSHASVTAARLSVDLLALEIASPGSSGRQRRGQVSGRLAP